VTSPAEVDLVTIAVEAAHRREWARVVAATVRVAGDLDTAEECAAEAYVAALQTWPQRGVPDNPGAWLTRAAQRKALDRRRREQTLARKLPLLEVEQLGNDRPEEPSRVYDERLRLVFLCAHPALALDARVALTLRLVCGLSTAQIAQAFLVPEPTMAARLTRAKKKIRVARIPFRIPPDDRLPERLNGVLAVVYLAFTTGYASREDDAGGDLSRRAIDLARLLHELMPDEPEVGGLLALLLLTEARSTARFDASGRVVLLRDQDRGRWDRAAIDEGRSMVLRALRGTSGTPGPYALQAAIAAVHADAERWEDTDWRQIVALYTELIQVWPNPVVAVNQAAAIAMVDGPAAGLALLDQLAADPRLSPYHLLPAARADLLRQLGRGDEAMAAYEAALARAATDADRAFLAERIQEVSASVRPFADS
jgi:RNA polymerase sigma-70 factor, ECF subfamily